MKSLRLLACFVALACFGVACGTPNPKPRPWNLSITKTTPASIEVDLIGVNAMERPAWEGYDMDRYWTSGDLRRANADKLSMNLPSGSSWTVPRDNPKWQQWLQRGATHLLLIANLPGQFTPGPADPRRVFIPLDKNSWDADGGTLQIEVQDNLVRVLTPQKLRN